MKGPYSFYYGTPNLTDYFPAGSFTAIDIRYPENSFRTIEEKIREQTYEKSILEIQKARDLVLHDYNLFALIWRIVNNQPVGQAKTKVYIKPEKYFLSYVLTGLSLLVKARIHNFPWNKKNLL